MSDKKRLQIRINRLQEMFRALGKDPNAKGKAAHSNFGPEVEITTLIKEFDRIVRKQVARLKKGRNQRLRTRQEILLKYGMRSRERTTIDEEINSTLKNYEADSKRLTSILNTYVDRKKPHISKDEENDRWSILNLLYECYMLFQRAYNEQSTQFSQG